MASTLHTHHFPRINDYDAAVRAHGRARVRTTAVIEGDRDLGTKSQTSCTIRDDRGTIAVRYHATDVLRYHPDGTVDITVYPSRNTGSLLRKVAPWINGMVEINGRALVLSLSTRDGDRVYKPRTYHLTVRPAGDAVVEIVAWQTQTLPIVTASIDAKRVHALRKACGADTFTTWLNATIAMKQHPVAPMIKPYTGWKHSAGMVSPLPLSETTLQELPERIADRSQWIDIAAVYGTGTMQMLREEFVRRDPTLMVRTEHPWIDHERFKTLMRKIVCDHL